MSKWFVNKSLAVFYMTDFEGLQIMAEQEYALIKIENTKEIETTNYELGRNTYSFKPRNIQRLEKYIADWMRKNASPELAKRFAALCAAPGGDAPAPPGQE